VLRRARIGFAAVVVTAAAMTTVTAQADAGRPAVANAGSMNAGPMTSGLATVEHRVLTAAHAAGAKGTIDVVVSLNKPASTDVAHRLSGLATWAWSFKHVAVAGLRLPVGHLDALRHVSGVRGVYLNRRLDYDAGSVSQTSKPMNTAHAWDDLKVTGKGITVAILDSGVDGTHPDLAPAMKQNVKLVELGAPFPVTPVEGVPTSDTSSGHGTHVAGDVAGRGIKSNGDYRGTAPDAGLVGVGAGEGLNIFTTVEGFDWILANAEKYGIRAVNNSWGSDFEPFDPNAPINVATKALADKGVVVLFAMGNAYDELTQNPWSAAPWVIPVAAGTLDGGITDFTSGGIEADVLGTAWGTSHDGDPRHGNAMGYYHPAVTSSGQGIVSTRALNTVVPLTGAPDDVTGISPDRIPYYTTLSGTSMATPETAGVVADILQADPKLTPAQVRSVLEVTGRPINGVPFWKQGYGYTDTSAAVELALSLAGKSSSAVDDVLAAKHTVRDNAVLADVAHPAHATAWLDPSAAGPFSASHKFAVQPGTARVKVVTNGPSTLELNAVIWSIAIADAKGNTVADLAASTPNLLSGTAVLDIDLHKLDPDAAAAAQKFSALAWGDWTVTVSSILDPADPAITKVPVLSEFAPKADVSTIAAAFLEPAKSCAPTQVFVPTGAQSWRLQNDDASGAPYPANPDYTYVGAVGDGTLANRAPARNLVGAFGEFTSGGLAEPIPRFTTAPLTAPLTLGQGATVQTWIQGVSQQVGSGRLEAAVLDVAPDGSTTTIVSTGDTIPVNTDPSGPAKTDAVLLIVKPYTVAAGHRLALSVGELHSQNTAADQLFFDSDQFPSGLTTVVGTVKTVTLCGVITPGGVGGPPVIKPVVQASGAARPGRLPATGAPFPFEAGAAGALALAFASRRLRRTHR